MKVGPRHYLTCILCAGVAALAVADLLLLNIGERRQELAQLQACGWRPRDVARLILGEGALLGVFGGALGVLGAGALMWGGFGSTALEGFGVAALALPLPILAGTMGAVVPALAALGEAPAAAVRAHL